MRYDKEVSFKTSVSQWDRIKAIADETGLPIDEILRDALAHYTGEKAEQLRKELVVAEVSSGEATVIPRPICEDVELTLVTQMPGVCPVRNRRGCYAWYFPDTGEVIRVGKSHTVRKRLMDYIRGREISGGGADMMKYLKDSGKGEAVRIKMWMYEDISNLESYLIHKYKPRFNYSIPPEVQGIKFVEAL